MFCIIFDRLTFAPIINKLATSYTLTTRSIYEEVSHIELTGPNPELPAGSILYLDNGYLGVIDGTDRMEKSYYKCQVRCRDMLTLFSRQEPWPDSEEPADRVLTRLLRNSYAEGCPDPAYRYTGLQVYEPERPLVEGSLRPTQDRPGLVSLKELTMLAMRRYGLYLNFRVAGNQLIAEPKICNRGQSHQLIAPSSGVELVDFSFGGTKISKVTACYPDGVREDYYLTRTGKVVKGKPPDKRERAFGEWIFKTYDKPVEIEEIEDIFMDGAYDHNITVRTPHRMGWGERATCKVHYNTIESYVAAERFDSRTGLWTYQLGDLDLSFPPLERI